MPTRLYVDGLFASDKAGFVPPSGGGASDFLCADGTWKPAGGAGLSDGDKGEITVSASGAVWTIDNGVITTAKLGGDITAAGIALLDDANAAAQRTTLGLGTAALSATGDFAAAVHVHAMADVTGLVAALAGKSDVGHTHPGSDLTGFTAGAIPVGAGPGLTEDPTKLFWDSGDRLGVGTNTPGEFAGGDVAAQPDTVAHLTRFGAASHAFQLIQGGTAKDAGVSLFTDTVGEDASIFIDHSDARKLKFSLGLVSTEANRDASAKMTLTQAGALGIGVSPANKLHVKNTGSGFSVMTIENGTADAYAAIDFLDSAAAHQFSAGYGNASAGVAHVRQLGYIYSATSKNFIIANPTRAEHTFGLTAGSSYYELHAGGDAAVSTASRVRLKYSSTLNQLMASRNAGTYGTVDAHYYISPAALASGTTANWNPSHVPGVLIRATPNAAGSTVGGLVALGDASKVVILNISASVNIVLAHESAGSTAANRFALPGAADYTLTPNSSVPLRYDTASARWRVCS